MKGRASQPERKKHRHCSRKWSIDAGQIPVPHCMITSLFMECKKSSTKKGSCQEKNGKHHFKTGLAKYEIRWGKLCVGNKIKAIW